MSQKNIGFQEKILEMVYKSSRRILWPVFVNNIFIFLLVYRYIDIQISILWLFLVTVIIFARVKLISIIYRNKSLSINKKYTVLFSSVTFGGVSHALAAFFIPEIPVYHQAALSLILAGLCMSSVFTNGGYKPLLYGYSIPIFIALIFAWTIQTESSISGSAYITGLVIFTFMLLLFRFANDIHQTFYDSYNIRLEHIALNARLKKSLANEAASSRSKTQFLAAASHDLRQPLNALSLYSAALNFQKLDDKGKLIAQNMASAISVLSNQLDSILDISKLDAGVVDVDFMDVNLNELVLRLKDEYKHHSDAKGILLNSNISSDIFINTDIVQFERILRNLLSNAIKYTEKGQINIVADSINNQCRIIINDTGRGIPISEQEKVFEEFYQLDNSSRDRKKGLGLGLSIVRRLCAMLNITINLCSEFGKGTSVKLAIPLSELSQQAINPLKLGGVKSQAYCVFQGLKILVIDDNEAIREGMHSVLSSLGSIVVLAPCTAKAIEFSKNNKPDIALVDYRLKREDNGIKAIKALRIIYPNLPAIIITGDIEAEKLKDIKNNGITMLHKPMKITALEKIINDILFTTTNV